jgi:hypothetical protein
MFLFLIKFVCKCMPKIEILMILTRKNRRFNSFEWFETLNSKPNLKKVVFKEKPKEKYVDLIKSNYLDFEKSIVIIFFYLKPCF